MDKSPLRKLPAELRNDIYEMVLAQSNPIELCILGHKDATVTGRWGVHGKGIQPHALALTCVCRQVQIETKHVFFAVNSTAIKLSFEDSPWGVNDHSLCGLPSPYAVVSEVVGVPDISYFQAAELELLFRIEDVTRMWIRYGQSEYQFPSFLHHLALQSRAWPQASITLKIVVVFCDPRFRGVGEYSVDVRLDPRDPSAGFQPAYQKVRDIYLRPTISQEIKRRYLLWLAFLLQYWDTKLTNIETAGQQCNGTD